MDRGPTPVPGQKPVVPVKPNTTRPGAVPTSVSQMKGRIEKENIGTDTGPASAQGSDVNRRNQGITTDNSSHDHSSSGVIHQNRGGATNTETMIMPVVPSPVRPRPVPAPRKPTPNSEAMHARDQTGQPIALVSEDQSESDSDFDDTVVYESLGDVIPRWLHLTVDRHQAEKILMERCKDGSFLVRQQQRGSGEYAISLKWDGGVKHITIDRVGDLYRFPGYPSFATLVELIQFHTEQDDQLQVMNTFVVLKEPVSSLGFQQNWSSEKEDQQVTASSGTPSPSQSSIEKSFRPLPRPPDDTQSGDVTPRRPFPSLPVQDCSCLYQNIPYQFNTSLKGNKPPPLPPRNSGNRKQSPQEIPLQHSSEADSLSVVVEASKSTGELYEEPPYLSVQAEVIWTSEQSDVLNIPGDIPLYQAMGYEASTSGGATEPSVMEESEYEDISQLQRQKPRPPLPLPGSDSNNRRVNSLHGLWSDNVRGSSIEELDSKGTKLQESLFEILTSEASYLKSLNLFVTMFLDNVNPMTTAACQLRKHEYSVLASNMLAVRKISSRFMLMIESEWKRCKPFLSAKAVCKLVTDHAQRYFEEYVRYVANHKFQRKQYDELKKTNKNFSSLADELQQHSLFRNISMVSFLSLPYQRITRVPLLVEAVAKRVQIGDDGYQEVQYCLEVLKKAG